MAPAWQSETMITKQGMPQFSRHIRSTYFPEHLLQFELKAFHSELGQQHNFGA